jgi:hypothetical protein
MTFTWFIERNADIGVGVLMPYHFQKVIIGSPPKQAISKDQLLDYGFAVYSVAHTLAPSRGHTG